MRQITKTIYKYDELPTEEAKARARDWYREGNAYQYAATGRTFKVFAEHLSIKILDYSYGAEPSRAYFEWDFRGNEERENLKGLRLRTWFINNFWNSLEKWKYMSTGGSYIDGKYHYAKRYSEATKEVSCPFTGVCFDEDILDPIRDLIYRYNPKEHDNMTFEQIINECFESFIAAVARDIEYQNSNEQVAETLVVNEYEFDENGEII